MKGFNKNISGRCFIDTSEIVSYDNITAKWLKIIISSILLGEKTFYIAFRLTIKLFIISTDHHQGLPLPHPTPSHPSKKKKKKRLKKFKFCETFLLFLRFTKIFSSVIISYLAQTGLPMATRSSRSSPTKSSKPLFPNSYFICGRTRIRQNKKEWVAKKTFTSWGKATIKAAAKDKMSDFYLLDKVLHLIALWASLPSPLLWVIYFQQQL